MPDLQDGESVEMAGSGSRPYVLKNVGGVYSCSCPAWRNQSIGIERRTCKHRTLATLPKKPGPWRCRSSEGAEGSRAAPALLLAKAGTASPIHRLVAERKARRVRATGPASISVHQNNLFHAPDWFVVGLPNVPWTGELWLGRKRFQRTVSIVAADRATFGRSHVRRLRCSDPRSKF